MPSEFDLIQHYFSRFSGEYTNGNIRLGVADDCAIFTSGHHRHIATSKDLLIEGVHFFSDVSPMALGHKALAVNLSDLAAMGASPIACLLGIALPRVDDLWLAEFTKGFYRLAEQFNCPLIGGDTTRHPQGVVISVTVFGEVTPPYMMRSQAQPGDTIWVSGELGAAHIALQFMLKEKGNKGLSASEQHVLAQIRKALEYPTPRVALGQALQGVANAAIDISDGLLQDLGHILSQSKVSAVVQESKLPISPLLKELPVEDIAEAVYRGGDVYELCFTAPPSKTEAICRLSKNLRIPLTAIGTILPCGEKASLNVIDTHGKRVDITLQGFDHFSND